MDDKVRLVFLAEMIGGAPRYVSNGFYASMESRHDASGGWVYAPVHPFSICMVTGPVVGFSQAEPNMVTLSIRWKINAVCLPDALRKNQAAVSMILRHERRHLERWDAAMGRWFQSFGGTLERVALQRRLQGVPSVQFLHEIYQRAEPRMLGSLWDSFADWDRHDWPDLHRALQRVGVPPDLNAIQQQSDPSAGKRAVTSR